MSETFSGYINGFLAQKQNNDPTKGFVLGFNFDGDSAAFGTLFGAALFEWVYLSDYEIAQSNKIGMLATVLPAGQAETTGLFGGFGATTQSGSAVIRNAFFNEPANSPTPLSVYRQGTSNEILAPLRTGLALTWGSWDAGSSVINDDQTSNTHQEKSFWFVVDPAPRASLTGTSAYAFNPNEDIALKIFGLT